MLSIFFVLSSSSFVQAGILLSSQTTLNTSGLVLTTPQTGNMSRKNLDMTPPKINLNISYYDWSISAEHQLQHPEYKYQDIWWVTIRDFYRLYSTPMEMTLHKLYPTLTTEGVTESAPINTATDHDGTSPSITDIDNNPNTSIVRKPNDIDLTRLRNIFRSGQMNTNFKKGDAKDRMLDTLSGIKARANAMKRNKQIQRMLIEITPKTEATKPAVMEANMENVNSGKVGINRSMNFQYNKIVESLQFNIGENKIKGLGGIKMEDLKQYYGIKGTPHPIVNNIEVTMVNMSNPVDRQGINLDVTESYAMPPWAWDHDPSDLWHDDEDSSAPIAVIPQHGLMETLKNHMHQYGLGYFSVFLINSAHIISEKPDKLVRLLVLSLEREYVILVTQDKYFRSFGQPFLKYFEHFATHIPFWSMDFVKHQAMVIQHTTSHRRHYFTSEVNSIYDYIDNLYQEDEGQALFKSLELVNYFPNTTQNSFEILRVVSNAVFAPYKRVSGTIKAQILVDSLNDCLRKLNLSLTLDEAGTKLYNFTYYGGRRFNNRTRFAVVGRGEKVDDKISKSNQIKTTISHANYSCKNGDCGSTNYNNKSKRNTSRISKYTSANKIKTTKRVKKDQAATRFTRLTSKHLKRQKQHTKDYKQKHHKIHKHIQLKNTNKKHRKKEKLRDFKNRYYGKFRMYDTINGNKKIPKINAEMIKHDQFNTSKTGLDDVSYSDETVSYSDYDTNDNKIKINVSSLTTRSMNIKFTCRTPKSTTASKITDKKKIYKPDNTKYRALPYYKDISRSNEKFDTFPKGKPGKNKITDLTSYSDDEDTLKFHISDAMRHDKDYKPMRRSYHIEKITKKVINEFSSYSSEEVVLKSNIYKAVGFKRFAPNEELRRANENDDLKFKKIRFQKFKPVNEVSSYSDEEDILREKLKL